MPQSTRPIASIPITLTSGTQTVNTLLDAWDLSMYKTLEWILAITSAATVVGTTLDVKFQVTEDNVVWDTRGRFPLVVGNQAASAGSPFVQGLIISQDVDLTAPERNYTLTGSNTGTELAAGTVRDGPFPRFLRLATGRTPSGRVQIVMTDSANSGAFAGTLTGYGHIWST